MSDPGTPKTGRPHDAWRGDTRVTEAGRELNETRALVSPIWQTSSFRAESAEEFRAEAARVAPGQFYTRYGNPNHKEFEAAVAALEGAEAALVTSSGMSAIFLLFASTLRTGDHVIAQRNHYAGATGLVEEYLPRIGVSATMVDQTRPEDFAAAIQPNTRLIYLESPVNPLLRITDLRGVAEVARSPGIRTACDNTFATPLNQQPLALGIDVVVHSATKYLGGHDDVSAGVLAGPTEFMEEAWRLAIVLGAVISPFDSWLLLRGLRTLALRIARQNENGLRLASFLAAHPAIEAVHYPGLPSHPQHQLASQQMRGFGGVLSIVVKGGYAAAERLVDGLRLATRAPSLGGVHTLIVHPASMWSAQLTDDQRERAEISNGLLRVSVGIEDGEDLVADFEQALGNR